MEFQFQQNSHAFSTSLNFQVKKPYKIELGKVLLINVHRRRLVIQSIGCNTTLRSVWGERTAYFLKLKPTNNYTWHIKPKIPAVDCHVKSIRFFLLIGVKKKNVGIWMVANFIRDNNLWMKNTTRNPFSRHFVASGLWFFPKLLWLLVSVSFCLS